MTSRPVETVSTNEIRFDPEKFRELVLYVAARAQEDSTFGATKLNKILYFSDFLAYRELGHPITGATYQCLKWGPAPRELLPQQRILLKEGDATLERRQHFQFPQKRLVPRREAKMEVFAPEEQKIVDQVIDALRPYTALDVSTMSHEVALGWQLAEDGEEIPYYTAYLTGEAPSESVIEWAQKLAAENGWDAEG